MDLIKFPHNSRYTSHFTAATYLWITWTKQPYSMETTVKDLTAWITCGTHPCNHVIFECFAIFQFPVIPLHIFLLFISLSFAILSNFIVDVDSCALWYFKVLVIFLFYRDYFEFLFLDRKRKRKKKEKEKEKEMFQKRKLLLCQLQQILVPFRSQRTKNFLARETKKNTRKKTIEIWLYLKTK